MLAAVPLASPVGRLQAPARQSPAQRILVLGGGLAGLCAAYELQKLGHAVTVLEAQARPGGRVRTLREPFAPGLFTEAGPETIPNVHDLTLGYAREFGLRLVPVTVPGTRAFYHVRGQRVLPGRGAGAPGSDDDAPAWPFDLNEQERKLGLAGLSRAHIEDAVQQALNTGWKDQPVRAMMPWDSSTPGAWLRSRGLSPAAIELLTLASEPIRIGGVISAARPELTRRRAELPHRRRQRPAAERVRPARQRPLRRGGRGRETDRSWRRRFDPRPRRCGNTERRPGGVRDAVPGHRPDLR